MKKLMLIAAFLLALTAGFSQPIIETTTFVEVGNWDPTIKDYYWEDPVFVDLEFLFYNNVIAVSNKAESVYIIKKRSYKDGKMVYKVRDQNYESCVIHWENEVLYLTLTVFYKKDYALKYYFPND